MTCAGHDDLQAGVEKYETTAGFGWLDDVTQFAAGRNPAGSETDERKITYVYDEYAQHPNIFEFDLPNGTYDVEVSVGIPTTVLSLTCTTSAIIPILLLTAIMVPF